MAGIIQRESKAVVKDEEIKYTPHDFDDYVDNYCSVELEAIDRLRYVEPLIFHFERAVRAIDAGKIKQVYEQVLADIEEGCSGGDEAAFTLARMVDLVQLSALALLEQDDQPAPAYSEWTTAVFKWLARERELFTGTNHTPVDKLCACIAVVEASFRPVPDAMTVFAPHLAKLIDRVKDADARGLLIRLAVCVVNVAAEREAVAALIADAIASPSEELVIHGIRAAAMFLDRFGDEAGLDGDILEGEIPSAGQRECGVSKANIDRESRDIWEFVRSEDGQKPRNVIVDCIDHQAEGFAAQEILRDLQRALNGSISNNFNRSRNGAFRITVRALGYAKLHRDRAHGKGKHEEQRERDQQHRDNDKERSAQRKNREKELQQGEDE